MELEKSESVLGSLYALRGGLSAISVEYDKARRIDGKCYNDLNSVARQYGGTSIDMSNDPVSFAAYLTEGDFKRELINKSTSISKSDYSKNINECNSAIYSAKSKAKKDLALGLFLLFLSSIAITVSLLLLLKVGVLSDVKEKGLFAKIFNYGLFAIFAGALTIVPLVFGIIRLKDYTENISDITHNKKRINEFHNSQENADSDYKQQRKYFKDIIDRLPQLYNVVDKIVYEREQAITPMVQSCNVYYKALLEQFSPILDERDWQHLDLVIYELETRRADNIKEALQLVDRELQTERIERTIGEATKAICYTLQRGFVALQDSIKICCDKICDRLDTISSQLDTMSMQMAVQSMQLAGISGQLADLTDSVNVNSALQAKANVTSAQLLSDVHAMRYYS